MSICKQGRDTTFAFFSKCCTSLVQLNALSFLQALAKDKVVVASVWLAIIASSALVPLSATGTLEERNSQPFRLLANSFFTWLAFIIISIAFSILEQTPAADGPRIDRWICLRALGIGLSTTLYNHAAQIESQLSIGSHVSRVCALIYVLLYHRISSPDKQKPESGLRQSFKSSALLITSNCSLFLAIPFLPDINVGSSPFDVKSYLIQSVSLGLGTILLYQTWSDHKDTVNSKHLIILFSKLVLPSIIFWQLCSKLISHSVLIRYEFDIRDFFGTSSLLDGLHFAAIVFAFAYALVVLGLSTFTFLGAAGMVFLHLLLAVFQDLYIGKTSTTMLCGAIYLYSYNRSYQRKITDHSLNASIADHDRFTTTFADTWTELSCVCYVLVISITILLLLQVCATTNDSIRVMNLDSVLDLNFTKVATMIERRAFPYLVPLVVHFLKSVPEDWPFVIWVGSPSFLLLVSSPLLQKDLASGRLNLTILPDEIAIDDDETLSRFLIKPWFWQQFHEQAQWMLFFQSDSMICSGSTQSIDDWIGYDWVGAPAPWVKNNGSTGGNGGLSMRKLSSMKTITTNLTNVRNEFGLPEDLWFMERLLDSIPDVKWPLLNQHKFSIGELLPEDDLYELQPLGLHRGGHFRAAGIWGDEDKMQRLMDYCPELLMLKWYFDVRQLRYEEEYRAQQAQALAQ